MANTSVSTLCGLLGYCVSVRRCVGARERDEGKNVIASLEAVKSVVTGVLIEDGIM
jgi:hypothetical protein